MHLLYNLGIHLYSFLIRLASPFIPKAKLWVRGRRDWQRELRTWRAESDGPMLWIHCASLGEFEQGRPVIEQFRKELSGRILLTFFSPSGYEPRKSYPLADKVMYLPSDTPSHARTFVRLASPTAAIFVKYEFWANYLFALQEMNVPVLSVSTILRPDQRFFKNGGGFWRKVLGTVDHFFVQNQPTADLLGSINAGPATIAGDTRYDRVVEISSQPWSDQVIEKFSAGKKVVVAGSSYEPEERICEYLLDELDDVVVIIAPHETEASRIRSLEQRFGEACTRWSSGRSEPHHRVLIIDSIGRLSLIYRYGNAALIGGGFGKGIHNVLEAAVYGLPVAFGPNWQRFAEARALLDAGGAESHADEKELTRTLVNWLRNDTLRLQCGGKARHHVHTSTGATRLVVNHLHTFFTPVR